MAHGKSLTLRAIQPVARFIPMRPNPKFVCTQQTCRAARRNIYFTRFPRGFGNMNKTVRETFRASIQKLATEQTA